MTFQPIIPSSGFVGWSFLTRTLDAQKSAHAASPMVQRDTDYFRENIGKVTSAEDLVKDRRLLEVALGAFGLQDDINNKYFIKQVLTGGTTNSDSLANRLSDNRYKEMSEAFGFGDREFPRTLLSSFPEDIIQAYQEKQFAVKVGEQNSDLRLALELEGELTQLTKRDISEDTMWYSVMGSKPLRTVFEKSLGLPTSIGTLDIEQQLSIFKDKAASKFSDSGVSQFADVEKREELLRSFLVRSEIDNFQQSFSPANVALTLLSQ